MIWIAAMFGVCFAGVVALAWWESRQLRVDLTRARLYHGRRQPRTVARPPAPGEAWLRRAAADPTISDDEWARVCGRLFDLHNNQEGTPL